MENKKKQDKPEIKSKKRVAEYGEVFTPSSVVKAMLDLVLSDTERIDSRFLEPACGTGNFLEEILKRKLKTVKKNYRADRCLFELYAFVAASSLYGIDIQNDNVAECRKRLFKIWNQSYTDFMKTLGEDPDESVRNAVLYVFDKNIFGGNTLTLQKNDGTPIIFSEWSVISKEKRLVKRQDFQFSQLMTSNVSYRHINQKSLAEFGLSEQKDTVPICEYAAVDFRSVTEYA